ncbi:MAG TPA: BamA/TamA family outer membrane protein [Longimicrobiales bacterium]
MSSHPARAAALFLLLGGASPALSLVAQEPAAPRGRVLGGVPALNYDADEGFGYGVNLELYDYGPGLSPYRYTLQPALNFSTGGKRDLALFFDGPHVLPPLWRVDAFLENERQIFAPWYGIGNATANDAALVNDANPHYYAFDRTRTQLLLNLQRALRSAPVRLLLGAGAARVTLDPVSRDTGTSLLAQQLGWSPGRAAPGGWSNFVRLGVVWDTRDREVGPRRGTWSELLVQRVDRALGSSSSYTRWTASDRRYFPLGPDLTYANRLLVQWVSGSAPFYDLSLVQTSFKQLEGLGGAKTLRGIPKNRYVDRGMALWNAELRWRAGRFGALGQSWQVVLSGFSDTGRVWGEDTFSLSGLHTGYGGGARLVMGENFVVAVDAGHSSQATAPIYIGLGYLY